MAQDLEKLLMTISRSSGSAMSRMVGALDTPKARRF
jgi:cellobiose-specific phosphotransferase system component IIA